MHGRQLRATLRHPAAEAVKATSATAEKAGPLQSVNGGCSMAAHTRPMAFSAAALAIVLTYFAQIGECYSVAADIVTFSINRQC